MNDDDLDTIFSVLENPIRRKILAKLAKEQHYPLQLSKELNISQQAIMKHLKVLEDNKLVISFEEKSTIGGPPRKYYVSNKYISLRIDVGPYTFKSEIYDYKKVEHDSTEKTDNEKIDEFKVIEDEFLESKKITNLGVKLKELSRLIQNIDVELDNLKLKRSKLLNIRETLQRETNQIISEVAREYNERRVLYYLTSHRERDLTSVADALDLREKVIEELFRQLMKQRIILELEDEII